MKDKWEKISKQEAEEALKRQGLELVEACKHCEYYLRVDGGPESVMIRRCGGSYEYESNAIKRALDKSYKGLLRTFLHCPYDGSNCFKLHIIDFEKHIDKQ